jgi:hypothetical protein
MMDVSQKKEGEERKAGREELAKIYLKRDTSKTGSWAGNGGDATEVDDHMSLRDLPLRR